MPIVQKQGKKCNELSISFKHIQNYKTCFLFLNIFGKICIDLILRTYSVIYLFYIFDIQVLFAEIGQSCYSGSTCFSF